MQNLHTKKNSSRKFEIQLHNKIKLSRLKIPLSLYNKTVPHKMHHKSIWISLPKANLDNFFFIFFYLVVVFCFHFIYHRSTTLYIVVICTIARVITTTMIYTSIRLYPNSNAFPVCTVYVIIICIFCCGRHFIHINFRWKRMKQNVRVRSASVCGDMRGMAFQNTAEIG